VLVHGIGHQVQELSELRGVAITNNDGTGITDAATLDLSIRAGSRASHLTLEGITQNTLKAVITNAVRALPLGIIRGVDQLLTGKVERIDKDFIFELIAQDRKSTRLNSSHITISYAVFCLKKKTNNKKHNDDHEIQSTHPTNKPKKEQHHK